MEKLQSIAGVPAIILWIICSIVVWRMYHKLFTVYYFGCRTMVKEFLICTVFGALIAGLVISYLPVAIGVIVLFIVIAVAKAKKQ